MYELYRQKPPLVLVAEDNKVTQRTITIFLQKQGYGVIEADDGQVVKFIKNSRNRHHQSL